MAAPVPQDNMKSLISVVDAWNEHTPYSMAALRIPSIHFFWMSDKTKGIPTIIGLR